MLNPARATSQVIGLSHPPYFEKTIEALRMLSCPRALVIRGVEGDPELSIGNSTRLLELKEERITPFTFQPKDAGLTMATFREMAGFPVEQREREADLIKRLLANEVQGGQRDWVLSIPPCCCMPPGREPRSPEILRWLVERWSQAKPRLNWPNWLRPRDRKLAPCRR